MKPSDNFFAALGLTVVITTVVGVMLFPISLGVAFATRDLYHLLWGIGGPVVLMGLCAILTGIGSVLAKK